MVTFRITNNRLISNKKMKAIGHFSSLSHPFGIQTMDSAPVVTLLDFKLCCKPIRFSSEGMFCILSDTHCNFQSKALSLWMVTDHWSGNDFKWSPYIVRISYCFLSIRAIESKGDQSSYEDQQRCACSISSSIWKTKWPALESKTKKHSLFFWKTLVL